MIIKEKSKRVPFVDLWSQIEPFSNEIFEIIENIIQRSAFVLGEELSSFETAFANYCEAKYAVGVDSGTSALELILRAYDIGEGDEVITAGNTFIATAFAISYSGATPVLVDINPNTQTIDPMDLYKKITEHTKAIIPVHLFGHPADMNTILDIAAKHNLIVIEDASQAHGARYRGMRVGGIGNAAAFSFYPSKNLGAFGEGGMVVTNDAQLNDIVRILRDQGQNRKYHHELKGYNHRLDNLQAAILGRKLQYLDTWNAARRRNAARYNQMLSSSGVIIPYSAPNVEPVYHLYVILVNHRDELREYLAERGIATGIHYPIPIHLQPAYRDLGYQKGDLPITEQYAERILSLPMYPDMSAETIEFVASVINEFMSGQRNY